MQNRFLNRMRIHHSYHPVIPDQVDDKALIQAAAGYFQLPLEAVEKEFQGYRQFHESQNYAQTLGERKTLALEEAFLIHMATVVIKPAQVVEIGTQHGRSTRKIVDILRRLDLQAQVTCFDITDELKFVSHDEVRLVLHDLTGDFRERVLDEIAPELIYLDAHPFYLLKNVISDFLDWTGANQAILAIHDCSPGLYNPKMQIPKDQPERITSHTGVWERHVLAEVFSVPESGLDDIRTPTHRLRVFGTRHGLALLAPVHFSNPS